MGRQAVCSPRLFEASCHVLFTPHRAVPRKLVVSILVTLLGPSSEPHGYEHGQDPIPYTSWELGTGGGMPRPPLHGCATVSFLARALVHPPNTHTLASEPGLQGRAQADL